MRVLFEPNWSDFFFKPPRLCGVRPGGTEEADPIRESWRKASEPILVFEDQWTALKVPLPEGGKLESIEFEIPLRLVLGWRQLEFGISGRKKGGTIREGETTYTLHRVLVHEDYFMAGLEINTGKVEGELDARCLEFELQEGGKSAGMAFPLNSTSILGYHHMRLLGFLEADPSSSGGARTLVVRGPGRTKDGSLVFELGPLGF